MGKCVKVTMCGPRWRPLSQLPSSHPAAQGLLAPSQGLLAFAPSPTPASPPLGGPGGRGCSYLPLEGKETQAQGRREIPSHLVAELRFQHNILLSLHRSQSETTAECQLFVGGKEEKGGNRGPPASLLHLQGIGALLLRALLPTPFPKSVETGNQVGPCTKALRPHGRCGPIARGLGLWSKLLPRAE